MSTIGSRDDLENMFRCVCVGDNQGISSTGVAEWLHPNTPLQKASGDEIYGMKLCSLAGMSSVLSDAESVFAALVMVHVES